MFIIGFRDYSFKSEDGRTVEGSTLYLGTPINENGDGYAFREKVNVSAKVFGEYEPCVGDEVRVTYYRNSTRVASIEVI